MATETHEYRLISCGGRISVEARGPSRNSFVNGMTQRPWFIGLAGESANFTTEWSAMATIYGSHTIFANGFRLHLGRHQGTPYTVYDSGGGRVKQQYDFTLDEHYLRERDIVTVGRLGNRILLDAMVIAGRHLSRENVSKHAIAVRFGGFWLADIEQTDIAISPTKRAG